MDTRLSKSRRNMKQSLIEVKQMCLNGYAVSNSKWKNKCRNHRNAGTGTTQFGNQRFGHGAIFRTSLIEHKDNDKWVKRCMMIASNGTRQLDNDLMTLCQGYKKLEAVPGGHSLG